MSKKFIFSSLILILFIGLNSCNLQPDTIYHLPSELQNQLEPWEGDIYFLEYELPKLHKNVYHSISQEDYNQKIAQLKIDCVDLDIEKQAVKLREFTASIGDAHTSYYSTMTHAFPLNIVILEDGVFVTAALEENRHLVRTNNNNTEPARVQLIAINGTPIFDESKTSSNSSNNIFSIYESILSHENESNLKNQMSSCLLDPNILYGAGITSSKDNCIMTFEFPDGSTEDIELEAKALNNFRELDWVVYYDDNYPADRSVLPDYIQYERETYYGKYYDVPENTLYILYNSCSNNPEQSFSEFISEQYSNIGIKTIDKVVVDLRNNGGGDSRIIKPLYNLLDSELANSDLYVITGSKTFSSALMNAIELSNKYDGTLIGGPTGGKPNHYGEVKHIQLPTGNSISWSTKYFTMIPGDNSDSLYPDISVDIESADFFALEDPIINKILNL